MLHLLWHLLFWRSSQPAMPAGAAMPLYSAHLHHARFACNQQLQSWRELQELQVQSSQVHVMVCC